MTQQTEHFKVVTSDMAINGSCDASQVEPREIQKHNEDTDLMIRVQYIERRPVSAEPGNIMLLNVV